MKMDEMDGEREEERRERVWSSPKTYSGAFCGAKEDDTYE
jgi:hypothetical protein